MWSHGAPRGIYGNVNVNLHSTLGSHKVLSLALYSDWFILTQTQLISFVISLYWGGATSPRLTPWGANRSAMSWRVAPPSICLQSQTFTCFYALTHSYVVHRGMVVGHIPRVHTCSLMCANHIDMIIQTPAFNKLGSALVRLPSHICQCHPWGDSNSQHCGDLPPCLPTQPHYLTPSLPRT